MSSDGRGATPDLFADPQFAPVGRERLGEQAWVLRGWAREHDAEVFAAVQAVLADAPLRHMYTPGGQRMAVATSSCGGLGWTSSAAGYRYLSRDPQSGRAWPAMPPVLAELAERAALEAGFADFAPDTCLINRYLPGVRLSLHQDRDEQDLAQPIVSLSLGLPAVFLFGGATRAERQQPVLLQHADVLVWGGVDRLRFHGVRPLKPGWHPLLGEQRINLTFRKAL
ncbi:DNA oxidative demethylase AlkB [Pseudomonas mangrovi]|uniref:DNA oxidative demethylase AlkB n=1 Tax=Pseudomonas mangrovi TaxID=2161748 RepID=A0A2T5PBX0_9PSED|nr:DNA oxidative demethylase AlkB [Pseudomonas mangrovi]PTU75215.1 DNA oxidative demethylase AlkB [Pseudomonas mangrovi]